MTAQKEYEKGVYFVDSWDYVFQQANDHGISEISELIAYFDSKYESPLLKPRVRIGGISGSHKKTE